MLQYQNHQLVQQLDHQRSEISALKSRCCQYKTKQTSYDDTLITVNRAWTSVSVALSLSSLSYLIWQSYQKVYIGHIIRSFQFNVIRDFRATHTLNVVTYGGLLCSVCIEAFSYLPIFSVKYRVFCMVFKFNLKICDVFGDSAVLSIWWWRTA